MIKELLNEEIVIIKGIAIVNVLVEGRNIVSHFLKDGDIIEYIRDSNMIVINDTKTFIHNIRYIEQYTDTSYNIHIK